MHDSLPLSALPATLQSALQPLLDAADFHGVLRPQEVSQLQQATGLDDDALALALLPIAACCAVAPVSHLTWALLRAASVATGTSVPTWSFTCAAAANGPRRAERGHACLAAG